MILISGYRPWGFGFGFGYPMVGWGYGGGWGGIEKLKNISQDKV